VVLSGGSGGGGGGGNDGYSSGIVTPGYQPLYPFSPGANVGGFESERNTPQDVNVYNPTTPTGSHANPLTRTLRCSGGSHTNSNGIMVKKMKTKRKKRIFN